MPLNTRTRQCGPWCFWVVLARQREWWSQRYRSLEKPSGTPPWRAAIERRLESRLGSVGFVWKCRQNQKQYDRNCAFSSYRFGNAVPRISYAHGFDFIERGKKGENTSYDQIIMRRWLWFFKRTSAIGNAALGWSITKHRQPLKLIPPPSVCATNSKYRGGEADSFVFDGSRFILWLQSDCQSPTAPNKNPDTEEKRQ